MKTGIRERGRAWRRALGVGAVALLAWAQGACQDHPGRQGAPPGGVVEQASAGAGAQGAAPFHRDGLEGGALVFSDDFERGALGEAWKTHPRATIVNGWLHIEGNRNEPPVWLAKALPEQVRVEFDARSRSPEGDIKVEVFGDGAAHASGYILVFGAHSNKEDWLARLDEHGSDRVDRPSRGVVKDRTYHMAIVRGADGHVRWFVDGEPFLMFRDRAPLRGPGHAHFAFNTWEAPLEFDNLRVYALDGER